MSVTIVKVVFFAYIGRLYLLIRIEYHVTNGFDLPGKIIITFSGDISMPRFPREKIMPSASCRISSKWVKP